MEEFPISTIRTHETYKGHVRQYCMFSTADFVLFSYIFSVVTSIGMVQEALLCR